MSASPDKEINTLKEKVSKKLQQIYDEIKEEEKMFEHHSLAEDNDSPVKIDGKTEAKAEGIKDRPEIEKSKHEDIKKATKIIGLKEDVEKDMAAAQELVTGIAHQLRNPLAIIQSNMQFCLSKFKLNEKVRGQLESVLRNARNAGVKLERLVEYVQPMQIIFRPVFVNEWLDDIASAIDDACKLRNIRLVKKYKEDLPPVKMDTRQMERAISCIIFNSFEAMTEGGELVLSAEYDAENSEIIIKIIDTGIAISAQHIDHVFDPFYTVKQDMIGLGLSLAKRIVIAHNGKIGIESAKGKGTTIIINLPITK